MLITLFKKIIWQRLTLPIRQFFKFCTVGFFGAVINLVFLWLLVEKAHFYYLLAATVSFILSVINNYFLNKYWTFNEIGKAKTKQFFSFLLISLLGLLINLFVMYLLVTIYLINYLLAQFVAIITVTFWNFFMNKYFTFKN